MTPEERRLVVGLLLGLTILVRLCAHQLAGGIARDQSDGLAREGGRALAAVMRLFALGLLLAVVAWTAGVELAGSVSLPAWTHWVGVALLEIGVALLVWVQLALGVHFSGTLHLREDHRLVEVGPYARVRHPMYTSFIALFLGIGLLMENPWVLGAMLATQVWTVFWRLPNEERSLEERFGDAWVAYRARTGALTPWV